MWRLQLTGTPAGIPGDVVLRVMPDADTEARGQTLVAQARGMEVREERRRASRDYRSVVVVTAVQGTTLVVWPVDSLDSIEREAPPRGADGGTT